MHLLCKKNAFVSIRTWFICIYLFVPGSFYHCLTALTRGWGGVLRDSDEWIFMVTFLLSPILCCFHRENQLPAPRPPHTAQPLPSLWWPWEDLTSVLHVAACWVVASWKSPSFSPVSLSLESVPTYRTAWDLVSVHITKAEKSLPPLCKNLHSLNSPFPVCSQDAAVFNMPAPHRAAAPKCVGLYGVWVERWLQRLRWLQCWEPEDLGCMFSGSFTPHCKSRS